MGCAISVLMPVYNGSRYLDEAIRSILGQTFRDFEFIIIDDGSTDGSPDIISSFDDPRIRLISNRDNLGLTLSLNKGILHSCGEYIARMDADDVSLPERLAKQVRFMDSDRAIGISGTGIRCDGESGRQTIQYPSRHEEIVCHNLFAPALAHPSVIMRRSTVMDNNLLYSADYRYAQDYELWVRSSASTRLANMNEALLVLRRHPRQVSSRMQSSQQAAAQSVKMKQLSVLGIIPSDSDMEIHEKISRNEWRPDQSFLLSVDSWLCRLLKTNSRTGTYPEPFFPQLLAGKLYSACCQASLFGMWTLKVFLRSPLRRHLVGQPGKMPAIILRCLLRRGSWRPRT